MSDSGAGCRCPSSTSSVFSADRPFTGWPPPDCRAGPDPSDSPLGIVGVLVNAAAVRARGADELDRPTRLSRGGPIALTRNPVHIGWSTIHLGTALATRLPGLVATWLGAVILVHRDIQREEGRLTEQFGAEYAEYAASVPRYPDERSARILIRSARARARTRPRRSETTRGA